MPIHAVQPPLVRHHPDGTIAEASQYDDVIATHRPSRYDPRTIGRRGLCAIRACHAPAVIDAGYFNRGVRYWRAMCVDHGRRFAGKVSPSLATYLLQMLDDHEAQAVNGARS